MSAFLARSNLFSLFIASALLLLPEGINAVAIRRATSSSYTCTEAYVPITATAQNIRFDATAPKTQLELAAIISASVAVNSNFTTDTIDKKNPNQTISGTWKLYTKRCIPKKWNGNVQVLVHGIAASHSYFEYPQNKTISYLDVAASGGNAVVNYDRLGVGESDHPDGINVVQSALDIEMLHQLVGYLKKRPHALTGVVMSKYPNDFTRAILTGFSPTTENNGVAGTYSFSPAIASQQNPQLFGRYNNDSSYVVTESSTHDLYSFFDGPPGVHYSADVFNNFVATKGAWTYGQQLTKDMLAGYFPAGSYTGDILVVTGEHDLPGCGGNCYQGTNGASVLTESGAFFPNAKSIATYIPANTAHAVFQHYTAPAVFGVINSWLNGAILCSNIFWSSSVGHLWFIMSCMDWIWSTVML
ncbi:hypothetical protein DL93DRAFT_2183040 [Clavulina sp. PMI_390]|nr:hypothetical protein DL93DRAFT_2183040 [Clavulina sp. PMI_390]